MRSEDIVDKLCSYLNEHLDGIRGFVYQEPYKRDLFTLFREAYRGGFFQRQSGERLLTADALGDLMIDRWFADDGRNEARERLLGQLMPMWQEWLYAWNRFQQATPLGDNTQRMRQPPPSTADLFKAEVDELEAITDMIQKFVDMPSREGKAHVKEHLARWLKHDDVRLS
jgi:hypothetical protein